MDVPAVEARSVVTRFGSQTVHNGISFSLNKGEVVALIGGSGTGKSVLLKEIIGLLRPTSGSVYLFGKNVWESEPEELKEIRQRFGVLFQNGALFSALSVDENIAVPFQEETDFDADTIKRLVALRLCLSGLSPDVGPKMPSELSGGMRKRVALARALALEPEILFLDEPTSGLDPINARAFDSLVSTLSRSLGILVFLVTHDLDTLEGIVDRVIVLGEGTIIADGPVREVKKMAHPWIQEYFSARTHETN